MVKPPYFGVPVLFFLAEQGHGTLGLGHLILPRAVFGGVYHIRQQCNNVALRAVRQVIRDLFWFCPQLLSSARSRTTGTDRP